MQEKKLKWGILGTAAIAVEAVIPALRKSRYGELTAIASRSAARARKTARQFNIPKAYPSYDDLLADEEIEAVYIPLPNHMHVPWSLKALQAGKHVLVEKPVALDAAEARYLLKETKKFPQLKIMEAFMYRFHPQWQKVRELVGTGEIGVMKTIQSAFSFFLDDPGHIVNKKEYGGGSLMDIGCYPISLSRFLFGEEPESMLAEIDFHPLFGTDTLATCILKFREGTSSFFSSTLLADHQHVKIMGTEGIIEMERPFNPPPDQVSRISLTKDDNTEIIEFAPCDQYALETDAFSLAVLRDEPVPTPLTDAVNNMQVIGQLLEQGRQRNAATEIK